MNPKEINIKNKRATYDYAIGDTYTAGIVLTGTEIKSLRQGKASLADTFCYVDQRGEVWVKNMYVAEYFYGTYNNHQVSNVRNLEIHILGIDPLRCKLPVEIALRKRVGQRKTYQTIYSSLCTLHN